MTKNTCIPTEYVYWDTGVEIFDGDVYEVRPFVVPSDEIYYGIDVDY